MRTSSDSLKQRLSTDTHSVKVCKTLCTIYFIRLHSKTVQYERYGIWLLLGDFSLCWLRSLCIFVVFLTVTRSLAHSLIVCVSLLILPHAQHACCLHTISSYRTPHRQQACSKRAHSTLSIYFKICARTHNQSQRWQWQKRMIYYTRCTVYSIYMNTECER